MGEFQRLLRRARRVWLDQQAMMDALIKSVASQMVSCDCPEVAWDLQFEFWSVCLPELLGVELVPAVLQQVIDAELVPDDQRDVLHALCQQYHEQRRVLITRVVQMALDYYANTNSAFVFEDAGMYTHAICTTQLERIDLGLETLAALGHLVPDVNQLNELLAQSKRVTPRNRPADRIFDSSENRDAVERFCNSKSRARRSVK